MLSKKEIIEWEILSIYRKILLSQTRLFRTPNYFTELEKFSHRYSILVTQQQQQQLYSPLHLTEIKLT